MNAFTHRRNQGNDLLEIMTGTERIGYVDPEGGLWGLDAAGFAHFVDQINHSDEINGKLIEWRDKTRTQGLFI